MTDPIPARLAALKTMSTRDLKAEWRTLFGAEPPGFNRRYLQSRLAYRIQELAHGGLKPETVRRLEKLGEELDGGDRQKSRIRADTMPIAGTRLIREWQGVVHVATVTVDGVNGGGKPGHDGGVKTSHSDLRADVSHGRAPWRVRSPQSWRVPRRSGPSGPARGG